MRVASIFTFGAAGIAAGAATGAMSAAAEAGAGIGTVVLKGGDGLCGINGDQCSCRCGDPETKCTTTKF